MKLTLSPKECTWIAEALYYKCSGYSILYHFHETLLLDQDTDAHTKKICIEYFFFHAHYLEEGLDKETKIKLVTKTLVQAIVGTKDPMVLREAFYHLNRLYSEDKETFTQDSDFLEILSQDFTSLIVSKLVDPKSTWKAQESCLHFFIREYPKNPISIRAALTSSLSYPNISEEVKHRIKHTLDFDLQS